MNMVVVYDDFGRGGGKIIHDVIGDKRFGEVVIKRKRLYEHWLKEFESMGIDTAAIFPCKNHSELSQISEVLENKMWSGEDFKVLHWFSCAMINDGPAARIAVCKVPFINENVIFKNEGSIAAAAFTNVSEYLRFLKMVPGKQDIKETVLEFNLHSIEIKGVTDLLIFENLIQCLTGNFEARFFNSLKGDRLFLVKKSQNKTKIRKEYHFWYLLPEDMQIWFVQPFAYQEDEKEARYKMKRYYMPDVGIKWVQKGISVQEFDELADGYFDFINYRHKKAVSKEKFQEVNSLLYEKKVLARVEELKKTPVCKRIEGYLSAGRYKTMDAVVNKYMEIKVKLERKYKLRPELVIGHGDLCFANSLYHRMTKTLIFIDPKGADTEEELWTDPYYDVAKLSHSVCGLYDFFNAGKFDLRINEAFDCELCMEFDNSEYKKLFREKLRKNGYVYELVRLYEASLFISMLPLHIDYPYKVMGFLFNGISILEELEEYV